MKSNFLSFLAASSFKKSSQSMLKALLSGWTKQPVHPGYLEPHLFLAIFNFQKLHFPNTTITAAFRHHICSKVCWTGYNKRQ